MLPKFKGVVSATSAMAGAEAQPALQLEALPIGDVWESSTLAMFLHDQVWFYRKQQSLLEAILHHRDMSDAR